MQQRDESNRLQSLDPTQQQALSKVLESIILDWFAAPAGREEPVRLIDILSEVNGSETASLDVPSWRYLKRLMTPSSETQDEIWIATSWPGECGGELERLIGKRIYWIESSSSHPSRQWRSSPLVTLVSSHPSKKHVLSERWQHRLNASVAQAASNGERLVVCNATPVAEWIRHSATRFQVPMTVLQIAAAKSTAVKSTASRAMHAWLRERVAVWLAGRSVQTSKEFAAGLAAGSTTGSTAGSAATDPNSEVIDVSPPVEEADQVHKGESSLPVADLALAMLPQRVIALRVRPKSKTVACLLHRLSVEEAPLGRVAIHVALHPTLEEEKLENAVARDLIARGAVGWITAGGDTHEADDASIDVMQPLQVGRSSQAEAEEDLTVKFKVRTSQARKPQWIAPTIEDPHWLNQQIESGWNFLTHCTRARSGKWPEQSQQQYLDELFIRTAAPRRSSNETPPDNWSPDSPVEVLRRILHTQRLVGTKWFQRSGVSAVCFSSRPLKELLEQRTYRPHLARWDWEPYGICVRKTALQTLGARPVQYRSSEEYAQLSDDEKAYFQKFDSDDPSKIDWRIESEWRVLGDVRLGRLAPFSSFAFVPTRDEARWLRTTSGFPILALETQALA